jgi:hypothetical protein
MCDEECCGRYPGELLLICCMTSELHQRGSCVHSFGQKMILHHAVLRSLTDWTCSNWRDSLTLCGQKASHVQGQFGIRDRESRQVHIKGINLVHHLSRSTYAFSNRLAWIEGWGVGLSAQLEVGASQSFGFVPQIPAATLLGIFVNRPMEEQREIFGLREAAAPR